VPRLPRNSTLQPALLPSKRTGFAASPIDTAMQKENQRIETRHVAALTMRSAKNEPHDASKVLRLPRETTMEVSKVLRL